MSENKTLKSFRKHKLIQLIVFVILELCFFIILITNAELREKVFTDSALFTLCVITWILFLLILITLLLDIYELRTFTTTSHELERIAYLDNKTGIPNKYSLDLIFRSYNTKESLVDAGCCLFTIANLGDINDVAGREAGDNVIQNFCNILEETGDKYGFVGRNGGNEFIMVVNNCTQELMDRFFSTFDKRINLYNSGGNLPPISIKYAYVINNEDKYHSFSRLLTATYNKLSEE